MWNGVTHKCKNGCCCCRNWLIISQLNLASHFMLYTIPRWHKDLQVKEAKYRKTRRKCRHFVCFKVNTCSFLVFRVLSLQKDCIKSAGLSYNSLPFFSQVLLLAPLALVWCICHHWWTNTDTLLFTQVRTLCLGSLFVLGSYKSFDQWVVPYVHQYSVIQVVPVLHLVIPSFPPLCR